MERRFRNIQTEWGFSKCISHATFKDPSNGYLVSDKCIFGVDVYVIKNQGIGECLSSLNDFELYKHEWKISEFTKLKNEVCSEEFTVGDCKWKLLLYPKGNIGQNGQNISVFLESVDAERFDCQKKVKAKFSISIKDRISGKHHKKSGHCCLTGGENWFSAAGDNWGWPSFMPLCELNDPEKGFLVEDCCIVQADVSVVGIVNRLT
ncbi:ubiquitin C-terminal hydrolase 13-like [Lycium ferocissimum]|uniref:ubiquitin C-terminal hydrolase 13-like n=1 Tax=Lycium ferocissimum TaxID=112874 RepID=UPI0028163F97|nr:ubiquitin C-terminal hydrolase 13-like [Lycium ferocissimum]